MPIRGFVLSTILTLAFLAAGSAACAQTQPRLGTPVMPPPAHGLVAGLPDDDNSFEAGRKLGNRGATSGRRAASRRAQPKGFGTAARPVITFPTGKSATCHFAMGWAGSLHGRYAVATCRRPATRPPGTGSRSGCRTSAASRRALRACRQHAVWHATSARDNLQIRAGIA